MKTTKEINVNVPLISKVGSASAVQFYIVWDKPRGRGTKAYMTLTSGGQLVWSGKCDVAQMADYLVQNWSFFGAYDRKQYKSFQDGINLDKAWKKSFRRPVVIKRFSDSDVVIEINPFFVLRQRDVDFYTIEPELNSLNFDFDYIKSVFVEFLKEVGTKQIKDGPLHQSCKQIVNFSEKK